MKAVGGEGGAGGGGGGCGQPSGTRPTDEEMRQGTYHKNKITGLDHPQPAHVEIESISNARCRRQKKARDF